MKWFGVLALLLFASCSNNSSHIANKKDSLDSVARLQKRLIDSAADKSREQVDSIEKEGKQMVDSTTEGKKRQLEKLDSARRTDSIRRKR